MVDAISIGLSGLNAAATRANAAASNIANAGTTGSVDKNAARQAYTPQDVVQVTTQGGGVRADVAARDPASVQAYDPNSPDANADGLVAVPNVDLANEIINLKMAELSYKASAKVIKTAAEMEDTLIRTFDETV